MDGQQSNVDRLLAMDSAGRRGENDSPSAHGGAKTLNDIVRDQNATGTGIGLMTNVDQGANSRRLTIMSQNKRVDDSSQHSMQGFIFGSDILLADGMENDFDWEMAISELESEHNLLLKNLLRTHNGPICTLSDEKGMTLLHHAVLKGVPGKTRFILEFSKTQKTPDELMEEWLN